MLRAEKVDCHASPHNLLCVDSVVFRVTGITFSMTHSVPLHGPTDIEAICIVHSRENCLSERVVLAPDSYVERVWTAMHRRDNGV